MSCIGKENGCKYAPEPHFIPPSMGEIGFHACNPPQDIINHTRCRPGTCDNVNHPDHSPFHGWDK